MIAAPPRLLGAFQGVLLRNLTATGSNRLRGMMLSGNGVRIQLPAASCTVEAGSKIGNPWPPNEKSPFSMSGVGTSAKTCWLYFSWWRDQPNRKKLLLLPSYSFGI